jgi:formiminotetrahydrofolate cyclodeaminase
MTDASATLDDFLNAAAARQPTPGGGAVAAVAGALAAAMGEMVLNYSVGKKDLARFDESNAAALAEFQRARLALLALMIEDQEAFAAYSDAKKNDAKNDAPKNTGDLAAATLLCAQVPLAIGATALELLRIANRVVSQSNRWLLSDLAVSGELATATVRCAVHNVRINLHGVADAQQRAWLSDECSRLQTQAIAEISQLIPAIDLMMNP